MKRKAAIALSLVMAAQIFMGAAPASEGNTGTLPEEEAPAVTEEIQVPEEEAPAQEPEAGPEEEVLLPEEAGEAMTGTEEEPVPEEEEALVPEDQEEEVPAEDPEEAEEEALEETPEEAVLEVYEAGLVEEDGTFRYRKEDGTYAVSSFVTDKGITYYMDEKGKMTVGWKEIGGLQFYFYASTNTAKYGADHIRGGLATGWQTLGGLRYYFYKSTNTAKYGAGHVKGAMATGWQTLDGLDYYFYGSTNTAKYGADHVKGAMATGWQTLGGLRYYFYKSTNTAKYGAHHVKGGAALGWETLDGLRFYFYKSTNTAKYGDHHKKHAAAQGWETLDGRKYYFYKSTNTAKYGAHHVKSAGAQGWETLDGNKYYFYKKTDTKLSGYVFSAMAKNVTIDGKKLGSDGKIVKEPALPKAEAAMLSKAQGYSSSTGHLILVNRSTHRVGIYKGSKGKWKEVKYWPCGDGAPSTPTIEGTFTVGIKMYYFDTGSNNRCWYATQFRGNYLFHSVLYKRLPESRSYVVDGTLGRGVSHGCVRLKKENARWIYNNIGRGTKVVVYH